MVGAPLNQPRVLYADAVPFSESDCACAALDVNPLPLSTSLLIGCFDGNAAESDCACASPGVSPAVARPTDNARTWCRPPNLYLAPLPGAQTLAFNPRRPGPVVVLNPSARRLLDSFAQPTALEQARALLPDSRPADALRSAHQLAALGLLVPFPSSRARICNAQSLLTAWLHLTDACNLHCSYCYVRKSSARMDEATGRAAVNAVFRSAVRHGYRAVKLKYAGGEPTLNFDLVRTLHRHAADRTNQNGLELHEVLLTNGVALTPEMLDFLKLSDIRLMISLDGVGVTHDAQRPRADGTPSSGLVLHAIDQALAHGLMPHISITVSPASAAGLAEMVGFVLDRDLPFNLNFVRGPGLPARDGGLEDRDWEVTLIAGVLAALAVIEERLPQRRLIDGLLDRCNFAGPRDFPCAAGRDYLAIDSGGQVARCHMILKEPITSVWADDPLSSVRLDRMQPSDESIDDGERCWGCSWRYVCGGGCPLPVVRGAGRADERSPYCHVYQALLPQLVRLEGLRILKWRT